MQYQIFKISSANEMEQLGTKEKFWFYDKDGIKKLFKIGRPNTGENWSEKATSELAKLIKLPCAEYEVAKWNSKLGTISTFFVWEDCRLIHGNELLVKLYDKDYPEKEFTVLETINCKPFWL